jgi:hypothetical protein
MGDTNYSGGRLYFRVMFEALLFTLVFVPTMNKINNIMQKKKEK